MRRNASRGRRIGTDYDNELQVLRLDFNVELQGDVARDLGVRSHPTTLLVDAEGAIVERFRGPVAVGDLRRAVEDLLAQ
ncbi:MAG: thioredoxin family protein [Dehalococcoidia bacterium]|nr:thioredoxin family protein [Dehalococcoidia bacterium]